MASANDSIGPLRPENPIDAGVYARRLYYQSVFPETWLRKLASDIRLQISLGKFSVEVPIQPNHRVPFFDLLESHGFHGHSLRIDHLRICWNFQCRRPKCIDMACLDGFPHGDDAYNQTVAVLMERHKDDVKQILSQVYQTSEDHSIKLELPSDTDPDVLACLCYDHAFHIHKPGTTLCWRWSCPLD